jgi:hypothetical protein
VDRVETQVSFLEDIAVAPASPLFASVEDARRGTVGDLTSEEYTLARVIASEHSRGSSAELCSIGDAVINGARASGRALVDHVTGGSQSFGSQGTAGAPGRNRPVSSARSPGPRHIKAALALLRGRVWGLADPPARGVARGARRFFDPKSQLASHRSGDSRHCHPLVILERWTFDLDWVGPCKLGPIRGTAQEEWVGPIPGVDAYELMLFRPAGRQQSALYLAARRLIESEGSDQAGPSELGRAVLELLVVLAVAAALATLLSGRGGVLV